MFERSHPGAVEACDVYWVGHTRCTEARIRARSWIIFIFDRDEKLIGFEIMGEKIDDTQQTGGEMQPPPCAADSDADRRGA